MDRTSYERFRHRLGDGAETTVHVVRHRRDRTRVRVHHFPRPERLDRWCRESSVEEAIVGGFFVRPRGPALGELWVAGRQVATAPFHAPWDGVRAAVSIEGDRVRIGPRDRLRRRPAGDLLQAGPLLVSAGRPLVADGDAEGFSAGADQFDSDITAGRYPRAALGLSPRHVIAFVCDGRRTGSEAGLSLSELAGLLAALGARSAINLDGGGSSTLVHRGVRRNRPYGAQDVPVRGGRRISTALVFEHGA